MLALPWSAVVAYWRAILGVASHPLYAVGATALWVLVSLLIGTVVSALVGAGVFVLYLLATPLVFPVVANSLERRGWIYEIYRLQETWEILDLRGERVQLTKSIDVRFLRDNVTAINDPAWGDGELFADCAVSPGRKVGEMPTGEGVSALIALSRARKKGDAEHFEMTRTVVGGFRAADEWIEVDSGNAVGPVTVHVVFPPGRPLKRAGWTSWRGKRRRDLGSVWADLDGGRRQLTLDIPRAQAEERYILHWQW